MGRTQYCIRSTLTSQTKSLSPLKKSVPNVLRMEFSSRCLKCVKPFEQLIPSDRLKLAYTRNPSDSGSNSCNLCNTTFEIREAKLNYPVGVVIRAKYGNKYQVEVQGNTFPACKFLKNLGGFYATHFIGAVNLQKWPEVDLYYFQGDHF